jgi:hypothetical protein
MFLGELLEFGLGNLAHAISSCLLLVLVSYAARAFG